MTTSFRKCHLLKLENSSPNQDSNPHSSIGDRLIAHYKIFDRALPRHFSGALCKMGEEGAGRENDGKITSVSGQAWD